MTKEDIKSIARLEGYCLNFPVYAEAFKEEIRQSIYIDTVDWDTRELEKDLDKIVTDYVVDCVNNFLQLERATFIDKLKDEIFRLFNIYTGETNGIGINLSPG